MGYVWEMSRSIAMCAPFVQASPEEDGGELASYYAAGASVGGSAASASAPGAGSGLGRG